MIIPKVGSSYWTKIEQEDGKSLNAACACAMAMYETARGFVVIFVACLIEPRMDDVVISSDCSSEPDSSNETTGTSSVVFTPTKRPPSPEFDRYDECSICKFLYQIMHGSSVFVIFLPSVCYI